MKPRYTSFKRYRMWVRPGGKIIISGQSLRGLAASIAELTVEVRGGRLVLSWRLSPEKIWLAKFKARFARISNVRNAAIDAMRRFMAEAPPVSVGIDIKRLIEEGRS